MIILPDNVNVKFTPLEREYLENGLSVATRLYNALNNEMQNTSDFGVAARNIMSGSNYLLGEGGDDSTISVIDPDTPTTLNATTYETLVNGLNALGTLVNGNTGTNNYYELYMNFSLPVTVGAVEVPIAVYTKMIEDRETEDYDYYLDYQFNGLRAGTYNAQVYIDDVPTICRVEHSYHVNTKMTYTYQNETPTWAYSLVKTYYVKVNDPDHPNLGWAQMVYMTMNEDDKDTLAAADSYFLDELNDSSFVPSDGYNWIRSADGVNQATLELFNLFSQVMTAYVGEESSDPTYETYEVTFTWPEMFLDSATFLLTNESATVPVTLEANSSGTGSATVVLTKFLSNGVEQNYTIDTSNIEAELQFKSGATVIEVINSTFSGGTVEIDDLSHVYVPYEWTWHNYGYAPENETEADISESDDWVDNAYPDGLSDTVIDIMCNSSKVGEIILNSDYSGHGINADVLYNYGSYTLANDRIYCEPFYIEDYAEGGVIAPTIMVDNPDYNPDVEGSPIHIPLGNNPIVIYWVNSSNITLNVTDPLNVGATYTISGSRNPLEEQEAGVVDLPLYSYNLETENSTTYFPITLNSGEGYAFYFNNEYTTIIETQINVTAALYPSVETWEDITLTFETYDSGGNPVNDVTGNVITGVINAPPGITITQDHENGTNVYTLTMEAPTSAIITLTSAYNIVGAGQTITQVIWELPLQMYITVTE